MLPRLDHVPETATIYQQFLVALKASSFQGTVSTKYSERLAIATDNSIYQVIPDAIIYPKQHEDVVLIFNIAAQPAYQALTFTVRGGGTGTNGQALNHGIIIDISKYMTKILRLDLENKTVTVQPGVILDQLNDFLKTHDYFFAPSLSPSNRATLGGMVSTDASGEGSLVFGKTSEHTLSLRTVMISGDEFTTKPVMLDQLTAMKKTDATKEDIYRKIHQVINPHREEIARTFPKLKRFMTGYNLEKCYDFAKEQFNLNYLLSGAEGTLAVITEITLRITPIPKHKRLVILKYTNFDHALRDAKHLSEFSPCAIETLDETVMTLAKSDITYQHVKKFIATEETTEPFAMNMVEFLAEDPAELNKKMADLVASIEAQPHQAHHPVTYTITSETQDMQALWLLRKRAVGMLGRLGKDRHPVAFIEDTLVPPESLADYVTELKTILDQHGLTYGMFGHVDVGCLHVRPALNLTDPADEKLITVITEQVNQLVKKYHGVLWGEHGKGFRSKYISDYFGPVLSPVLQQIKTIFDPNNRLNPGKITTALDTTQKLVDIQGPMRGQYDRQIPASMRHEFYENLQCNGNGACFSYQVKEVMCPSYKATGMRIHSPKGRSVLLREWLRLLNKNGPFNLAKIRQQSSLKRWLNSVA